MGQTVSIYIYILHIYIQRNYYGRGGWRDRGYGGILMVNSSKDLQNILQETQAGWTDGRMDGRMNGWMGGRGG